MTYATGTITSATQPAKDLMDTIGGHLVTAGWEFVEEVAGTGTRVARVYRCPAALSGFTNDFYVALVRSSLTSFVGIVAGETYDSGAKTFGHGCVLSTNPMAIDAGMGYGTARHVANENTMIAGTAGFLLAPSYSGASYGVPVNTGGFTYHLLVTSKLISLSTQGSGFNTANNQTVGLYEPFHDSAAEPFPLVSVCLGVSQDNGATSRATGLAPSASYAYPFNIMPAPYTPIAAPGSATSLEKISGKHLLSRAVLSFPYATGTGPRGGAMPGYLPAQVKYANITTAAEAQGDTLESGNWVIACLVSASQSLAFKTV